MIDRAQSGSRISPRDAKPVILRFEIEDGRSVNRVQAFHGETQSIDA
jgi:hypothetical protein